MVQTRSLTISPRPAINVDVDLLGKHYVIPAPKTTLGLVFAQRMEAVKEDPEALMGELKEWIDTTFGPKEGPGVYDRLFDPKDPLDIPDIAELIKQLTEVGGNPTT